MFATMSVSGFVGSPSFSFLGRQFYVQHDVVITRYDRKESINSSMTGTDQGIGSMNRINETNQ